MFPTKKPRSFSREFKLKVVKRDVKFVAEPFAPMAHAGALMRQTMLEERLASKILKIRIVHPALPQLLIREAIGRLQKEHPDHEPDRLGRPAMIAEGRGQFVVEPVPVELIGQEHQFVAQVTENARKLPLHTHFLAKPNAAIREKHYSNQSVAISSQTTNQSPNGSFEVWIARQDTLDDLDTVFRTSLPNDLSDTQSDVATQDLVAVFGDPHQVIAVVVGSALSHAFVKFVPPLSPRSDLYVIAMFIPIEHRLLGYDWKNSVTEKANR